MRKRLLTVILTVLMSTTLFPMALAATTDDIDSPEVFIKQTRSSGTCTLASAAMMLRRVAILEGDPNWWEITEATCRSAFWRGGLPYDFSYGDVTMGHGWLPGGTANRDVLADILAQHPEGIVLHSRSARHGILLTDYTDGVFYCADPAPSIPSGRIPIDQAWGTRIENSNAYWYVTSPVTPVEDQADVLPLRGHESVSASDTILTVSGHLGLETEDQAASPIMA